MNCHGATLLRLLLAIGLVLPGCAWPDGRYRFHGDPTLAPYLESALAIEYPDVQRHGTAAARSLAPDAINSDEPPQYWDVTLEEAMQLALANNTVLRDLGAAILRTPSIVPTTQDPAIRETDPRFGVEAALAEFDTSFSYNAFFEKNDRAVNNVFIGGGTTLLKQDLQVYQAQLAKRAAAGTELILRHNTIYDANNAPANIFGSAWDVNIEGEIRQPLLQRAGVDFNRIAGPDSVPGFYNGVLIARVNTDITLADFELGLRDFVSNVENAYWDLYFAYRDLDAKVQARDAALETWRRIHALYVAGRRGGEAEKEAESREQYFRFQEEVQNALEGRLVEGTQTFNGSSGGTFRPNLGVRVAERRLRLLMGLPISDGRLIRPADEPRMVRVLFDWDDILHEALARRAELRKQKWNVKRRELELIAARNYLLPTLDAIGRYRWRGFGKDLLGYGDQPRFQNAYQTLTSGDFQEWQLGVELDIPLGYRRGHAAVRNAQLLLARERALLDEQEREVVLGLTNAVADAQRAYEVSQTAFNRRLAAWQQLQAMEAAYESDRVPLFLVLDAQRRLAEAEARYAAAQVEYALAVKNVHFEKGTLLDYNEIFLAEGPWPWQAHCDAATRRPWRRHFSHIMATRPITAPAPHTGPPPYSHVPDDGVVVVPRSATPAQSPEPIPAGTAPLPAPSRP
jgi:outer membrane protein TolC